MLKINFPKLNPALCFIQVVLFKPHWNPNQTRGLVALAEDKVLSFYLEYAGFQVGHKQKNRILKDNNSQ